MLLQDPQTSGFVGTPNVFVSHAWSYKFIDVVQALCEFAESQPEPEWPVERKMMNGVGGGGVDGGIARRRRLQ